jgi:hypothetical protein
VAYSNFTNSQINGRKSGRCKDVINISGIGGKAEDVKSIKPLNCANVTHCSKIII